MKRYPKLYAYAIDHFGLYLGTVQAMNWHVYHLTVAVLTAEVVSGSGK